MYKSASQLRIARGAFNLGYMHEHGLGLPKDLCDIETTTLVFAR